MTSFIITSPNQKIRDAYIKSFCEDQQINLFDRTIITRETASKTNIKSIGIETIKQMQKKLFLKPIRSKTKIVILEEAHLLTTEAQNALLKVLEEPPEHTIIVLSANSKESLLPTIISRCQVIELQTDTTKLKEKDESTMKAFLESLSMLSTGERLKKAEQLAKDKEKAIVWTGKLIVVAREKLIQDVILASEERERPESLRMTNYVKSLQSLYAILKTTNVNPRFAIETTFLNLKKDH